MKKVILTIYFAVFTYAVFGQPVKVQNLPTTTTGSVSDYLMKINAAGTLLNKMTITNFATLLPAQSLSIAVTPIISGTAKAVLYQGPSNLLQQDASNFVWDYTNHRLGIGTATPSDIFHVYKNANNIVLGNFEGGTDKLIIYEGTNFRQGITIGTTTNSKLGFFTNGSYSKLLINTNGYVGINVSSENPITPLEVDGLIWGNPNAGGSNTTLSGANYLQMDFAGSGIYWGFRTNTSHTFVLESDHSSNVLTMPRDGNIIGINNILALTPTSTPGSPSEGWIYVDSGDHHIYEYNGTSWKQLDN